MKKIVIVLVLFILVGCSSSTNEYIYDQDTNSEETQERIEEVLPESEEKEVPKLYDKAKGWNEIQPIYDYSIQIDDLYFEGFPTVEEFLNLLGTSENRYEHSINKDGLLSNKENKTFAVSRVMNDNSYEWMKIKVTNIYDETVPILKGIVSFIGPTEEALPYCRFIDGRSYTEIISMKYSEVGEYMHELENKFTYSLNMNEVKSQIPVTTPEWLGENFNYANMGPEYFFWEEESSGNSIYTSFSCFPHWPQTGYKAVQIDNTIWFTNITYSFVTSKDSGQVSDFDITSHFIDYPYGL